MSSESRPAPSKHNFQKTKRLLDDFFKVDEYVGSYEQYDNEMSAEQRLLVFERGDSVAALVFDTTRREVILVEQFRLPTVGKGLGGGWILETAAGIIEEGESAREAIINELKEESGYGIKALEPIGSFFVSPGGSSERIFLFYAEVQTALNASEYTGVKADGEDIRVVRIPIEEFYIKLFNNGFEDAKLIIAGHWLKDRLSRGHRHPARRLPPVERSVSNTGKIVGYYTGDILQVQGVEAWVNPLNTDMQLDRYTDHTVSAKIRIHGAELYQEQNNRLMRDTIGDALRTALNGRTWVAPAMVLATPSGRLKTSNQVKRIFHVATSKGEMGPEVSIDLDVIKKCVANVLNEAEGCGCRSILIPILGTGGGGLDIRDVAPILLREAVQFFKLKPGARLQKIYFLPYSEVDAVIFAETLARDEFSSSLLPAGS